MYITCQDLETTSEMKECLLSSNFKHISDYVPSILTNENIVRKWEEKWRCICFLTIYINFDFEFYIRVFGFIYTVWICFAFVDVLCSSCLAYNKGQISVGFCTLVFLYNQIDNSLLQHPEVYLLNNVMSVCLYSASCSWHTNKPIIW